MKKIFLILIPLFIAAYFGGSAFLPQTKKPVTEVKIENSNSKIQKAKTQFSAPEHEKRSINCKSCHISEYPTKKDPGLLDCPRNDMLSVYHSLNEGPDVVVIDEMSENYMGVVFSHKIHAEMSEMSTGCTGCHHYNTTGPVLNCRNCHESTRNREDVSVPDLKAAFHRQCMTCHKQWSNENGCNKRCHALKDSEHQQTISVPNSKSHPELPVPTKLTWETNSKINKTVTFYHDEHVSLFKINCTSCHTQESCIKCHSAKGRNDESKPVKIEKSLEEHHKPCSNCHMGNSCQKCHNDKEMLPFNHARSTGWSLTGYHSGLECTKCHGSKMPYRKLDNNCTSCHNDFTTRFDHKLKGFSFSEAHKDLECENCHVKGDFKAKPVCTDCHDDKSYPANLPGKKIRK